MNIQVKNLMELLSYNGLINPVTLPAELGKAILEEDNNQTCFVEMRHTDHYDIWYPITTWYDECKRRSNLEKTIDELTKQRCLIIQPEHISKNEILKQLVEAGLRNDRKEIERLTQMLTL